MNSKKTGYSPPKVVTLEGHEIVGLLGPVSAGSSTSSGSQNGNCIPAGWMQGC